MVSSHSKMIALLLAGLAGCGATGDKGGGAAHLPVSGAGPFQPIADAPNLAFNAPFVLSDPAHDLDEPTVVVSGDALALWVTIHENGTTDIQHADAITLDQGFGDLLPALQVDQAWEAGAVSGPSVIWDKPWVLFYSAAGAIGWATAEDGHTYHKAPGPALTADDAEEGHLLGAPAAARVGDRVIVYYEAAGSIWAATAPWADIAAGRATTFTRLDGDPSTPVRDPMVAPPAYALSLARPQVRVAMTPGGRLRYDLYFTAIIASTSGPPGSTSATAGFASSFTGELFEVAPAPILPIMESDRSPAETPYQDHAILLYAAEFGARQAIGVATSP